MLLAEQWLDLADVQPRIWVFQIVRQLVSDLSDAGMTFAGTRFRNFFERFRHDVSVEGIELGARSV
jgi:hypothetical protein